MPTLEGVIQEKNWQGLTAQEIHEALWEATEHRDPTLISWAGLIPAIGQNGMSLLMLRIDQAIASEKDESQLAFLKATRWSLDNTKLNLSLEDNQNGIELLRPLLEANGIDADKIKALGVWHVTEWEKLELDEPSLEDVQSALQSLTAKQANETRRQEDRAANTNRWNDYCNRWAIWDGTGEAPEL